MRVLLVEELASGALADQWPGWLELASEGSAMLRAIAADAAAVEGWEVEVVWSQSLGPFCVPGVTVHPTTSPEHEQQLFSELAGRTDRTFVIAPELDQLLLRRQQAVAAAGGRSAGSSASAISLCGDKLRLAGHFQTRGISTIPTRLFDSEAIGEDLAIGSGLVVKPIDGAGSLNTFHLRHRRDVPRAREAFREMDSPPIVQPFITGRSVSVAAIVSDREIALFPLATQRIHDGDQLSYGGGAIGDEPDNPAVLSLVLQALQSVPGLCGYVGVDVIIPEDGSATLVVEINPRLTTSYLGYRQLAKANLAPLVITPEEDQPAVAWRSDRVEFAAG